MHRSSRFGATNCVDSLLCIPYYLRAPALSILESMLVSCCVRISGFACSKTTSRLPMSEGGQWRWKNEHEERMFALRPTVDSCESFVLFCAALSRLRRTWMRRALRGRSSASANRQLHECNDLLKKLETLQAKHKR